MERQRAPQVQAMLDQIVADYRDTVIEMADAAAGGHDQRCNCTSSLCPGPVNLTFLQTLSPKEIVACAGIAIRMLGDERAKNGRG